MSYKYNLEDSDDDWTTEPIQSSPPPVRPSKKDPASEDSHKEWVKERQSKGKQRFDRKQQASRKRTGS